MKKGPDSRHANPALSLYQPHSASPLSSRIELIITTDVLDYITEYVTWFFPTVPDWRAGSFSAAETGPAQPDPTPHRRTVDGARMKAADEACRLRESAHLAPVLNRGFRPYSPAAVVVPFPRLYNDGAAFAFMISTAIRPVRLDDAPAQYGDGPQRQHAKQDGGSEETETVEHGNALCLMNDPLESGACFRHFHDFFRAS